MPFNLSEANKENTWTKLSLSLKRNNEPNLKLLQNENITKPCASSENANKANRLLKRPLNSTYLKTSNAAKRLKTLQENPKESLTATELTIEDPQIRSSAMLNGHHQTDNQYGGNTSAKKTPIASLSNLGNTCFLNSVLYTLRYAPQFLHNLHHLVSDLASVEQKLGSVRLKSSSLGRSAAGLASSGTRSWSSKDLLSLGQTDSTAGKSKIQIATERLHETYASLRTGETKCLNSSSLDATPEPFAAEAFLKALREVNSTFEGNKQQDAHELLICVLNNIRETCRALSARASRLQLQENGESNGLGRQPSIDGDSGKPTLGNLRKSWKKRKETKPMERRPSPTEDREATPPDTEREERTRPGWDFVAENFEGTMVTRTTCLECETVRETRQAMCDVCVPVSDDDERADRTEPFRAAATTTEYLRDQNKYWCGVCLRYVEARRSVGYARLPRLLVLQLRRFSGGMQKITRYAPTPMRMPCFCEKCARRPIGQQPLHRYNLWAVIMHFGQTLSGGHYVAYARDGNSSDAKCEREGSGDATTANASSSFMRTLFNRPRPQPTGCAAKECCVPPQRSEACWLFCDDELVTPITDEEFEDLLSAEPKTRPAATPYLLFYVKSEVG